MQGAARRLTLDTLVYGIGTSANRVVSILFVPVFTRIFSTGDYGALDLLTTLNSLLGFVAVLGLNSAIFFYYGRTDDLADRRRVVGSALAIAIGLSVLLALVGIALAVPLSTILLGDSSYALAATLAFVWLPASVAAWLAGDLLRLEFRPVAYSVLGLFRTLIASAIGVVLAAWAGMGVAGLIGSQAALAVVAAVVALWLTRQSWAPALELSAATRMLRFGVPLVPTTLAYWLMGYSDRYVLVVFHGLSAVGLYAIANKVAQLVQVGIGAFLAAWWPFAYAHAKEPGHTDLFARAFRTFAVAAAVVAVSLGLFAREALLLFTTPEFVPAYPFVGLLALALVVNGAYQMVSIGVALAERTWHMAWTSAAAAGLNVVLNVALIPPFGLLGASASTLAAYLVSTALLYRLSQRAYPIPYDLRVPAVVSAAAAVALAVGLALDATASAATWLPGVTAAKAAVFLGVAAVSLRLAQVSLGDLLARIVALRPAGRPTG